MVTSKPPFLSTAQIAQLHTLMGRGLQTVQDFQEPAETITIKRRDSTLGWVQVMTLTPISIRVNAQSPQETPGETRTDGEVKVWATDLTVARPRPGDRFTWQGHACVIDIVPPERLGTVLVAFTLLESN